MHSAFLLPPAKLVTSQALLSSRVTASSYIFMMDIKLRPTQENDFIFAWQLYELLMKPLTEELLPWKEDRQKEVIRKAVKDAQTRIVLVDDEKAGWLQIDESNDHIYIGQIYINPDLQGKGIGRFLIQNIIQQAKADGKALKLSVMKNNPAKAFYERLGFKVAAEDQFQMPHDMAKFLIRPRGLARELGAGYFKPQTVLLRWKGLRGGGIKPGEAGTLKEWS
jgi:ribosomal protein S18 acetylase RimI-like enzyme